MLSRIMDSDLGTMMFPVTWSGYLTLTMGNHISYMECLDPVQTLPFARSNLLFTGMFFPMWDNIPISDLVVISEW